MNSSNKTRDLWHQLSCAFGNQIKYDVFDVLTDEIINKVERKIMFEFRLHQQYHEYFK
jgi:hypothetical protein